MSEKFVRPEKNPGSTEEFQKELQDRLKAKVAYSSDRPEGSFANREGLPVDASTVRQLGATPTDEAFRNLHDIAPPIEES